MAFCFLTDPLIKPRIVDNFEKEYYAAKWYWFNQKYICPTPQKNVGLVVTNEYLYKTN